MKQIISGFSVLFFVMMLSCNTATTKNIEFFYYPSRNVYYDVEDSMYFYSLDGGKTWDSSTATSSEAPATLGNKQIIYSTVHNIWKDNDQHIKQYNGQVIDITENDSTLSQTTDVEDRKINKPKPVTPVVDSTKKTEKRPGFFKRLFGRKKSS